MKKTKIKEMASYRLPSRIASEIFEVNINTGTFLAKKGSPYRSWDEFPKFEATTYKPKEVKESVNLPENIVSLIKKINLPDNMNVVVLDSTSVNEPICLVDIEHNNHRFQFEFYPYGTTVKKEPIESVNAFNKLVKFPGLSFDCAYFSFTHKKFNFEYGDEEQILKGSYSSLNSQIIKGLVEYIHEQI